MNNPLIVDFYQESADEYAEKAQFVVSPYLISGSIIAIALFFFAFMIVHVKKYYLIYKDISDHVLYDKKLDDIIDPVVVEETQQTYAYGKYKHIRDTKVGLNTTVIESYIFIIFFTIASAGVVISSSLRVATVAQYMALTVISIMCLIIPQIHYKPFRSLATILSGYCVGMVLLNISMGYTVTYYAPISISKAIAFSLSETLGTLILTLMFCYTIAFFSFITTYVDPHDDLGKEKPYMRTLKPSQASPDVNYRDLMERYSRVKREYDHLLLFNGSHSDTLFIAPALYDMTVRETLRFVSTIENARSMFSMYQPNDIASASSEDLISLLEEEWENALYFAYNNIHKKIPEGNRDKVCDLVQKLHNANLNDRLDVHEELSGYLSDVEYKKDDTIVYINPDSVINTLTRYGF